MARQLDGAPGEIRVLFTPAEAAGFLRGGSALPGEAPDDPLHRAARRVLKGLALDFATAAESVELCVERLAPPLAPPLAPRRADAPDADAGSIVGDWYAVRFRLTAPCADAEERRAVDAWMAEHAPVLAFAVEREVARPVVQPIVRDAERAA